MLPKPSIAPQGAVSNTHHGAAFSSVGAPVPVLPLRVRHKWETRAEYGITCDGCRQPIVGTRLVVDVNRPEGVRLGHYHPSCVGECAEVAR